MWEHWRQNSWTVVGSLVCFPAQVSPFITKVLILPSEGSEKQAADCSQLHSSLRDALAEGSWIARGYSHSSLAQPASKTWEAWPLLPQCITTVYSHSSSKAPRGTAEGSMASILQQNFCPVVLPSSKPPAHKSPFQCFLGNWTCDRGTTNF